VGHDGPNVRGNAGGRVGPKRLRVAAGLLQYFPEEIEYDLLTRGIDIADWWNGTVTEDGRPVLSSRRLVAILTNLPDDSAFKSAFRDDWSEAQYMQAAVVNELRNGRSDQAAFHKHNLEAVPVKSPAQQRADRADEEYKSKIRARILAQLNKKTE
jgi:hypothetical protein